MLFASLLSAQVAGGSQSSLAKQELETVHVGDVGDRIVAYIKKTETFGFSGAVLAAKDGQVIAAVAVGAADLKGEIPNTPSTLFEIASATKQFTAAAVMRLVQDGKLSLDDPMSRHLPGVPDNCSAITVRQLLQHTSGIPGTNSFGAGNDLAKVLPVFLRGGPTHPPGTHWEYWNQGYSLASEIIARASGLEYTAYCQRALFAPAGMSATRFTGDAPPNIEGVSVAVGRSSRGKPRGALEHPYGEYGFQYRGMGGAVTNVWDLWRWDRALKEQREGCLLKAETQAELFKPGLNDYALGWIVLKDVRGKTLQHHGGSVRGFVCELRRLPDDDGCVFVLANRDDVPADAIARSVQAILLGPPYTYADAPGLLPPDLAREIAGKYKDAKGNALAVEADGKVVRATIQWSENKAWTTRAFIGADEGSGVVLFEWEATEKVTISRDDNGTVTSLSIGAGRFDRSK